MFIWIWLSILPMLALGFKLSPLPPSPLHVIASGNISAKTLASIHKQMLYHSVKLKPKLRNLQNKMSSINKVVLSWDNTAFYSDQVESKLGQGSFLMKFHQVNKALSNANIGKIIFLYHQDNPNTVRIKEKSKPQEKKKHSMGSNSKAQ